MTIEADIEIVTSTASRASALVSDRAIARVMLNALDRIAELEAASRDATPATEATGPSDPLDAIADLRVEILGLRGALEAVTAERDEARASLARVLRDPRLAPATPAPATAPSDRDAEILGLHGALAAERLYHEAATACADRDELLRRVVRALGIRDVPGAQDVELQERGRFRRAVEAVEALVREAERLRHGVGVEGDFVCGAELWRANVDPLLRAIADEIRVLTSHRDARTSGAPSVGAGGRLVSVPPSVGRVLRGWMERIDAAMPRKEQG